MILTVAIILAFDNRLVFGQRREGDRLVDAVEPVDRFRGQPSARPLFSANRLERPVKRAFDVDALAGHRPLAISAAARFLGYVARLKPRQRQHP